MSSEKHLIKEKRKRERRIERLGIFTGKNSKKILRKALSAQNRLEQMKEEDEEKAKEFIEKQRWQVATLKAQGVKVKDDISLIKKSVKKQSNVRKHSAKKWKSRVDSQKKIEEERQQKRHENIAKRRSQVKQKKYKKLLKKGHLLPELKDANVESI